MYQHGIKLWFIVSFIVCNVFSHEAVTLKASHDTQIKLLGENSDPCSENPCKNEGVCTVNNDDYKCDCKKPYSGKQCETHPCHSSPCLNEGACIAVENTYGCVCNEPFHGRHCEIDPCSPNPCQHEGVCTVAGIDFNCSCKQPYSGKECENDCDCGGGTCQFKDGVKSCKCFSGYIFDIDTCKECDCGVNGKCRYVDGKRECVCFGGYGEKDGKCIDCDCGIYGKCVFVNDEKHCICEDKYVEKNGTCQKDIATTPENEVTTTYYECDCGSNSTGCHLDNGTKVCACKNGYAQDSDGICTVCNCGKKAYDCAFKNGRKKCYCSLGYAELDEDCKECNCETTGGYCEFENGKKTCKCFDHQRYFQGKCKYCYCGWFANDCGFFEDGKVKCDCQEEYVQRKDFCVDFNSTINETTTAEYFTSGVPEDDCYCGENSVNCSLDWRRNKVCKCKPNFAQKNETCVETCNFSDRNCFNRGVCRREGKGTSVAGYFCQCNGTYVGSRCETDVCETMRYKCRTQRAVCTLKRGVGVCECPQGMTHSRRNDMCEEVCDYRTCVNGRCEVRGNNSYICICVDGCYGLHCEYCSTEMHYMPLGIPLILLIGIVIFSIASIIAVQWVKKLRKQIEDAKVTRNT